MSQLNIDSDEVSLEFINYYYNLINSKNIDELGTLFKNHTHIKYNDNDYKSLENIGIFFKEMFELIKEIKLIKLSSTCSGTRRFNVLIQGQIILNDDTITNYSEYIQFGQANDKRFWIKDIISNFI